MQDEENERQKQNAHNLSLQLIYSFYNKQIEFIMHNYTKLDQKVIFESADKYLLKKSEYVQFNFLNFGHKILTQIFDPQSPRTNHEIQQLNLPYDDFSIPQKMMHVENPKSVFQIIKKLQKLKHVFQCIFQVVQARQIKIMQSKEQDKKAEPIKDFEIKEPNKKLDDHINKLQFKYEQLDQFINYQQNKDKKFQTQFFKVIQNRNQIINEKVQKSMQISKYKQNKLIDFQQKRIEKEEQHQQIIDNIDQRLNKANIIRKKNLQTRSSKLMIKSNFMKSQQSQQENLILKSDSESDDQEEEFQHIKILQSQRKTMNYQQLNLKRFQCFENHIRSIENDSNDQQNKCIVKFQKFINHLANNKKELGEQIQNKKKELNSKIQDIQNSKQKILQKKRDTLSQKIKLKENRQFSSNYKTSCKKERKIMTQTSLECKKNQLKTFNNIHNNEQFITETMDIRRNIINLEDLYRARWENRIKDSTLIDFNQQDQKYSKNKQNKYRNNMTSR